MGTAGVIVANINFSALSQVFKNKAERIFSALSGRRTELVQRGELGEREPGIRDIFGLPSAWAESITPEMVKEWFENRKEPPAIRLDDGTPVAPFGKGYAAVRNGHIGVLRKDGSGGLAFTTGRAIGRGKGEYRPKFEKQLKSLGISELDDDKVSIVYAGKRTEREEKVAWWYYYIVQPRMKGVISLRMTDEFNEIQSFLTSSPVTEDFNMIALPNNGCAVVTQDELLVVQPGEDGKLHMVGYSLHSEKEGGKKPINPKLAYGLYKYDGVERIIVAVMADNWGYTHIYDITTGGSGTITAMR